MSRLPVAVFLFLTPLMLQAQTLIQGTVRNRHNSPIPYSSMGIRNSRVASLANENGGYRLVVPDSVQDKTIIFSAIGHFDRSIKLSDLKKNGNVVLEERVATLDEVVINATKLKQKTIGQRSRPMITFSRMFDHNVPSIEQGSVFEIFPQTRLKSYGFYIMPSSKFQRINLKLNLYSVNRNTPETPLLHQTILVECNTTGWQRIDLSRYNLKFRDMNKIAITLQLVDHTALANVPFIFGLSAKKSFEKNLLFRYQNQGNWEASQGTFISNLDLAYSETGDKNQQQAVEDEIQRINQDNGQINTLAEVLKHREKAKKTSYGKSRNGKYLDVKDGKIYFEEYGTGRALLLLHGNGGSISDFYLQIPYLSKDFRVIAIDTRGQGRSTNLSQGAYSYHQFSDDLLQLTKSLKLEKVSILGWSDGGNTGLLFNAVHPQLVEKLVTVGANLNPGGIKEELIAFFNKRIQEKTEGSDIRLIELMLNEPQMTSTEIERITNPVLIIAGSADVIKEDHTRIIGTNIKGSRVMIIPNATHYVPFDQPDMFNNLLYDFLKN